MGQAKQRGTLEQRIAQAQERDALIAAEKERQRHLARQMPIAPRRARSIQKSGDLAYQRALAFYALGYSMLGSIKVRN